MTIGRGDSRMPGFQYSILKVYVLYRETEVARSASPLIVGVGVEANLTNVGIRDCHRGMIYLPLGINRS